MDGFRSTYFFHGEILHFFRMLAKTYKGTHFLRLS